MTVSPRRLTAACSRSTSCCWRSAPPPRPGSGGFRWAAEYPRPCGRGPAGSAVRQRAGGGAGGGCGGSRMPFWTSVITGGVLSAASCVVAVRFWMICVCWAASDSRNSARRRQCPGTGRRQDAGVDEEAQRDRCNLPTMLGKRRRVATRKSGRSRRRTGRSCCPGRRWPLPEAEELVMLPDGEARARNRAGREVDEAGIGPGEAADRAVGGAGGVAGRTRSCRCCRNWRRRSRR